VYDEFFAPSLIATEPLDPDWGKPIPAEEIDKMFTEMRPYKTMFDDSKG
jgi:hypothetical protein